MLQSSNIHQRIRHDAEHDKPFFEGIKSMKGISMVSQHEGKAEHRTASEPAQSTMYQSYGQAEHHTGCQRAQLHNAIGLCASRASHCIWASSAVPHEDSHKSTAEQLKQRSCTMRFVLPWQKNANSLWQRYNEISFPQQYAIPCDSDMPLLRWKG